MIDTHCHLTDHRLGSQLDDVLKRAAAAGVDRMITIATDLADSIDCIELCKGRASLRCSVGVHPNLAHEADLSAIPQLNALQLSPSVVAIGEIGLDYHYSFQHRQRQLEVFRGQMQIAKDCGKPVVIHSREATDDCLSVLGEFPGVPAVFHCFTGTAAEARRVLDAGHWLSYTGVITFKNADEQRQAVALTPFDRLLVETDAPYLSPEPHRKQKVNEPALVVYVADQVAQIKGVDRAAIDKITTANVARFFGWG